jgi:deoxyribonuclease V
VFTERRYGPAPMTAFGPAGDNDGFGDDDALIETQRLLAVASPEPWFPTDAPLTATAAYVVFERGESGPGRIGDRAWAGAAVVAEDGDVVATAVATRHAPAPYLPGLLGRREGPLLAAVLRGLPQGGDVLLIDATGRDHPRRAGLALHLGALLDVPSVGITDRPLRAGGPATASLAGDAGATASLVLDGEVVAAWVRTQRDVRPVVAHAGWRTDVDTAVEIVRRFSRRARTPEPLRAARTVARTARARDKSASAGGPT